MAAFRVFSDGTECDFGHHSPYIHVAHLTLVPWEHWNPPSHLEPLCHREAEQLPGGEGSSKGGRWGVRVEFGDGVGFAFGDGVRVGLGDGVEFAFGDGVRVAFGDGVRVGFVSEKGTNKGSRQKAPGVHSPVECSIIITATHSNESHPLPQHATEISLRHSTPALLMYNDTMYTRVGEKM